MSQGKRVINMAKIYTNKTSSGSGMPITSDQLTDMIRKKAYELYEKRGKKQGRDLDNWLEAERMIKQKV
jgi:hypothetical protein